MKSNGLPHIEIVVVDAASTDGSSEIEADFPQIRLIRMPRNFGRTRARNNGVRTATGQLVLFLDPCVEVQPDTVAALATALADAPDAVAAGPAVTDASGNAVVTSYALPSREQLAEVCLSASPFPAVDSPAPEALWDGALMVRKQFIAGMNYFDEKSFFEHYAELDLFRQIRNAGKRVMLEPEATCVRNPRPELKLTPDDCVLLACDRVAGAASYLGKLGEGSTSFFISMIFKALSGRFKPCGAPSMKMFTGLLSGLRIDGTHRSAVL